MHTSTPFHRLAALVTVLACLTACGGGGGDGGEGSPGGSLPPASKGAVDILFAVDTAAASGTNPVQGLVASFPAIHGALVDAGYDPRYALVGVNSSGSTGDGLLHEGPDIAASGGAIGSLTVVPGSAPVPVDQSTQAATALNWRSTSRRLVILVREQPELVPSAFGNAELHLRTAGAGLALWHGGSLAGYDDLLRLFTILDGAPTDPDPGARTPTHADLGAPDIADMLPAWLDAHNQGPFPDVGLLDWRPDEDEDGFPGAVGGILTRFFAPSVRHAPVGAGVDCDDSNPQTFPGAPEIPGNLIDDNCNGRVDE